MASLFVICLKISLVKIMFMPNKNTTQHTSCIKTKAINCCKRNRHKIKLLVKITQTHSI